MKNKKVGIIGIIIFVIALGLILTDNFENDFLNKLSEYGKIIAAIGGGLIAIGFFGKKKN